MTTTTKTETKFTPGPWNACKMEIFSTDNDKLICELKSGTDSNPLLSKAIGSSEAEANARLIASAPELLEALKTVLLWSEMPDSEQPKVGLHKLIADKGSLIRAAILKAEGENK